MLSVGKTLNKQRRRVGLNLIPRVHLCRMPFGCSASELKACARARGRAEAKARVGHGHYLAWLEGEFHWGERTARRYVAVAEQFSNRPALSDLSVRALLLLAGDSTPPEVRDEVIERAEEGERIHQGPEGSSSSGIVEIGRKLVEV
jgi:hypothetical protein